MSMQQFESQYKGEKKMESITVVGTVVRTEILFGSVYSHGVNFDKNMLPSPIESVGVSITTKGEKLYDLGQKVVLTITTSDSTQP